MAGEGQNDGVCLARSRYGVDSEYSLLNSATLVQPCPQGASDSSDALIRGFVAQCNSDWWKFEEEEGDQDPIAQLVMDHSEVERQHGRMLLKFAACGGVDQR